MQTVSNLILKDRLESVVYTKDLSDLMQNPIYQQILDRQVAMYAEAMNVIENQDSDNKDKLKACDTIAKMSKMIDLPLEFIGEKQ